MHFVNISPCSLQTGDSEAAWWVIGQKLLVSNYAAASGALSLVLKGSRMSALFVYSCLVGCMAHAHSWNFLCYLHMTQTPRLSNEIWRYETQSSSPQERPRRRVAHMRHGWEEERRSNWMNSLPASVCVFLKKKNYFCRLREIRGGVSSQNMLFWSLEMKSVRPSASTWCKHACPLRGFSCLLMYVRVSYLTPHPPPPVIVPSSQLWTEQHRRFKNNLKGKRLSEWPSPFTVKWREGSQPTSL